ncbi:unnamed protein product [Dracunculus medinensis]|uniref:Ovule protein n=1 Tax=Dracunculus medinensis TaxID=318479 RepID=A0A0N4UHR1_DRAME|nr:unnamed protein product [Dracunculus medinensis]
MGILLSIKAVKVVSDDGMNFLKPNLTMPSVVPNITDLPVEPYVCNCEPPTEKEILSVILKLKANKTSGEDGLWSEFFKSYPPSFITHLQCILWYGKKK